VGCALRKLMLNQCDLEVVQKAVHRVHHIVILGTELCNLLLRRWLQTREMNKLRKLFDANFVCKLLNAVSSSAGKEKEYDESEEVYTLMREHMCLDLKSLPSRRGLTQCLGYEARSIAALAKNNVWMHFVRRVGAHVRNYLNTHVQGPTSTSSTRLLRHQITLDMCRTPGDEHRSPVQYHAYVQAERLRLGLSDDIFFDSDVGGLRPIAYQLKKSPHLFLPAMDLMSREREQMNQSAFALFPLRRDLTPRHVHFDEKCFRDLLRLPQNPYHARCKNKETKSVADSDTSAALTSSALAVADGDGTTTIPDPALTPGPKKRVRRSKDDLVPEKTSFFSTLVNLRACNIRHPENFAFHLTTDGVCARALMRWNASSDRRGGTSGNKRPRQFPTRGVWCIDALKEEARKSRTNVHVIGVDPGKREIIVAVDMDDTHVGKSKRERKGTSTVRYTASQRSFETRCVEYDAEVLQRESQCREIESALCGTNSRSASFETFAEYVRARRQILEECLRLRSHLRFRKRRWKASIKAQRSEARLFNRLKALHKNREKKNRKKKRDSRPLVLAYGSWGLIAGRPTLACNRGNAPCIGVGLMRKLSKHFVVCLTPEAYTSKTCCKCLGPCGPCTEIDDARISESKTRVRGLRRCQNEECMIFLNRDRNGATNIGNNFKRLFEDRVPIRELSDDEVQLNELRALCEIA